MIDLLNSDWLIGMLEKSSKQPQARMLALFDVLDDWLNAPRLKSGNTRIQTHPSAYPKLLGFITQQAAELAIKDPQLLASQVCLMALAAAREKLQNPNVPSFSQAKVAANALIEAHKPMQKTAFKPHVDMGFGLAATLALGIAIGLGAVYWPQLNRSPQAQLGESNASAPSSVVSASPEQTAALFAQLEFMRKGDCQLPEALQLPDAYKSIYIENIVMGQVSTNVEEQKIVRHLLEKVRCNYTPMLMQNSKG